jgi:hypothetical protein
MRGVFQLPTVYGNGGGLAGKRSEIGRRFHLNVTPQMHYFMVLIGTAVLIGSFLKTWRILGSDRPVSVCNRKEAVDVL